MVSLFRMSRMPGGFLFNIGQAFFRGFTARHPILSSFITSVYFNAGFTILGYVVKQLNEQFYEVAVDRSILKPLEMTYSSVTKSLNDS